MAVRSVVVPPGGFAGFAQQTPATQNLFQRAGRIGGRTTQRRRRNGKRKAAKSARLRSAPRRARRGKKARLTKGSPAARAYMAKLRRMRKR
jgi:hypothetical protein